MPYADPDKQRAANRRNYLANRERYIARAKARTIALRESDEGREKLRTYKRTARATLVDRGLTQNGTPRKAWRMPEERTRLRALIARLRWWRNRPEIRGAMALAAGQPWRDPRLCDAERLRLRYALDPGFHDREYERLQRRKRERRSQERRLRVDLTPGRAAELRAEATHCAYCGQPLGDAFDRTLDHVIPLSVGGPHAESNVVPACRSCNSAKQDKCVTPGQGIAS